MENDVNIIFEKIKNETRKADKQIEMLKGTPAEYQIKAYVIGIMFAYNVLLGKDAKSIFD